MSDFQFKNVTFDLSSDPLRAEFRWWGELDPSVYTRFHIWVHVFEPQRNALLAVHVGPGEGQHEQPYLFDFETKEKADGGSVVAFEPGRLIVDFPRFLLRGYGPGASWSAGAEQGLVGAPLDEGGDSLDSFSDEGRSRFDTTTWFG